MKLEGAAVGALTGGSLSARRAWIEIWYGKLIEGRDQRRSPQGERGLKFSQCHPQDGQSLSLSARRAWIEIKEADMEKLLITVALRKESVD